jgi:hypothetical protein
MMLETYAVYWPWAITFGLFAVGVAGIWYYCRDAEVNWAFCWFTLIAFVGFLLVQAAFRSFQFRYLLPLLPLWCIFAGRGMGVIAERISVPVIRSGLILLILLNLVFMTTGVMVLQRSTFGDLVRCATYLQDVGTGSRVLSNEAYRPGVYAPKMKFWSGRDILYYYPSDPTDPNALRHPDAAVPQAGDLLALHNTYAQDLERIRVLLEKKFKLTVIRKWTEIGIPLLPDIMVYPSKPALTSNPECMAFRFFPQPYYTVLLRLEDR